MNKLTDTQLAALCEEAKEAAKVAGRYIQSQFDKHYVKKSKAGGDSLASQVVTEVDIQSQDIVLEGLSRSIRQFDLGLLTEEAVDDSSRQTKDYFWCIDPMDGTLPFTEHRTGYAVSIALISQAGDPVVGVAYVPDLARCYSAVKGAGLMLDNKPFERPHISDNVLHVYWDISFASEPYFVGIKKELDHLRDKGVVSGVEYHLDFGGVRNAIGVMSSARGCYFKFPKPANGCGSIWDYAATRLFFEEAGLCVSDAKGGKLHLNDPDTTFMNGRGVLYATDAVLQQFVKGLGLDLSV